MITQVFIIIISPAFGENISSHISENIEKARLINVNEIILGKSHVPLSHWKIFIRAIHYPLGSPLTFPKHLTTKLKLHKL